MILDLGLPILNYFGTFSIIFTDFYGLSSFDEISGFNLINCYPVGRLIVVKLFFLLNSTENKKFFEILGSWYWNILDRRIAFYWGSYSFCKNMYFQDSNVQNSGFLNHPGHISRLLEVICPNPNPNDLIWPTGIMLRIMW